MEILVFPIYPFLKDQSHELKSWRKCMNKKLRWEVIVFQACKYF